MSSTCDPSPTAGVVEPVVLIHGGAWSIPDGLVEASCRGVVRAARAGLRALSGAGSALDAVQAAVCVLEDDPTFDAGEGLRQGQTLREAM